MFDIGWSEMALILMVALVVIGPKDLPRVARSVGKWSAKARSMARDFQRSLDDMAREAELQDIKDELGKLSRTDMRARLERTIDPDGALRRAVEPPRELHDDPARRHEYEAIPASDDPVDEGKPREVGREGEEVVVADTPPPATEPEPDPEPVSKPQPVDKPVPEPAAGDPPRGA